MDCCCFSLGPKHTKIYKMYGKKIEFLFISSSAVRMNVFVLII